MEQLELHKQKTYKGKHGDTVTLEIAEQEVRVSYDNLTLYEGPSFAVAKRLFYQTIKLIEDFDRDVVKAIDLAYRG